MNMKHLNCLRLLFLCSLNFLVNAEFSACPLLGSRFPIPKSFTSSSSTRNGLQKLTEAFDEYVAKGDGGFGPITPNTTSFSVGLFSAEQSDSAKQYFYEYHYTASGHMEHSTNVKGVNSNTTYEIGDMTTLFTVWLFLINAGEEMWSTPVTRYVPELARSDASSQKSMGTTEWERITLGDLAAHLGGIGRYVPLTPLTNSSRTPLPHPINIGDISSPCEVGSSLCDRTEWLRRFRDRAPVVSPASTPIFSNAGFIILAFALESITGRSYSGLLSSSILDPLDMSNTFLKGHGNSSMKSVGSNSSIEAAYSGLISNIHDLSAAFRAILSSRFLKSETTNRWLKPVAHTSNRANSVGRPWEIFSMTTGGASPVIPVYQVRGNIGKSSSHMGLLPDYGVGFVILGTDSQQSPDLNAHADLLALHVLPALEKAAMVNANALFSGSFASNDSSLIVAPTKDTTPGLAVTNFTSGGKDMFKVYAELSGILRENLSLRLYPTGMSDKTLRGDRVGFRAVLQDTAALADAGTPTCDTWRFVDELQVNGVGIDQFGFDIHEDGEIYVEAVAFQTKMLKKASS